MSGGLDRFTASNRMQRVDEMLRQGASQERVASTLDVTPQRVARQARILRSRQELESATTLSVSAATKETLERAFLAFDECPSKANHDAFVTAQRRYNDEFDTLRRARHPLHVSQSVPEHPLEATENARERELA